MNTNENKLDRGKILESAVKESGMSIEVIIKRLGYSSRATYYRHINTPNLSIDIIHRYGKVIKHDFSAITGESQLHMVGESPEIYIRTPSNLEEAINQRDFYLKMYLGLLEEYRKLEADYNSLLQQTPKK